MRWGVQLKVAGEHSFSVLCSLQTGDANVGSLAATEESLSAASCADFLKTPKPHPRGSYIYVWSAPDLFVNSYLFGFKVVGSSLTSSCCDEPLRTADRKLINSSTQINLYWNTITLWLNPLKLVWLNNIFWLIFFLCGNLTPLPHLVRGEPMSLPRPHPSHSDEWGGAYLLRHLQTFKLLYHALHCGMFKPWSKSTT